MTRILKVTEYPYQLNDIIVIHVPPERFAWARRVAPLLDKENKGRKTNDGGEHKNVKGCLGQWAVNEYLNIRGWDHDYSEPYVEEQYGDKFDIGFCGDIFEKQTAGVQWGTTGYRCYPQQFIFQALTLK